MIPFVTLTTPLPVAPGLFSLEVPDGWQQGRGAYGGFVLASIVRAIESTEDVVARPFRSLTAELPAPLLPGPAEVRVEVLRRGSGVTTVAARVAQEGGIVAHAVGVLARAREDASRCEIAPPVLRPWQDLPPVEMSFPPFAQFFEYRMTSGLPLSGHTSATTETWVRLRPPCPRFDAAHVAALADATWPALLATMREPRPMGTLTFMLQFFPSYDDLELDAPLYHRGRVIAARDGYSAEMRELWTPEGRLVSLNQQTFVTIR